MKLFSTLFLAGFAAVAIAAAPSTPDKVVGDAYTLDMCPISGMKLSAKEGGVAKVYNGREIRFCCGGCPARFEADPAKYMKKIDAEIVKQQRPYYPLTTCMISGEALTEDGKDIGVDMVYNNRLVRLCCNGCKRGFMKDPAAHLKKIDEAIVKTQGKAYPLTKCVISGEDFGDKPAEIVVGNRLVRLCCKGCIKAFKKNPAAGIAMVDAAWKKQGGVAKGTAGG